MPSPTNAYKDLLKEIARKLVGDGGSPNIFFLTKGVGGDVVGLLVGDDCEEEAIQLAARWFSVPITVEDRQAGVVWENAESLRGQEDDDA
jgi:hypothetical protein